MKKIIVDNFEMITHQELTLDTNLNIIIGPQASGKSTLVKLIFFCRKLRDYLMDYLTEPRNFQDIPPSRYMSNLHNYLRRIFMGYFDTKNMKKFKIRFYVDVEQGQYITLTLDDSGYLHVVFKDTMWLAIRRCLRQAAKAYHGYDDFVQYRKVRNDAQVYYKRILDDLFHDDAELIYIPAGRSVLSILADAQSAKQELSSGMIANNFVGNESGVDFSMMDTLFQDFLNLIQDMRRHFDMPLNKMILKYQKTGENYGNTVAAERAIEIISDVLRAEYRNDNEVERLYYTNSKYVRVSFASSGQQEVLWILNLIFLKILENRRIFLVLEEPEAHLFPIAQKSVVDLIALLINSTGSSVFITTHSPYILTSVNLSVYSAQVENNPKLKGRPDSVIRPYLRISPEKYNAFMTPDRNKRPKTGQFLDCIKEEESGLIDATRIDEVSNLINGDTDRLIDLEVQYDL